MSRGGAFASRVRKSLMPVPIEMQQPDILYDEEHKKIEILTPDYAIFRLQNMYSRRMTYYGLPGTDGGFWSNFMASLKAEHSVVSICTASRASPFSHLDRFLYLFITWGLYYFFTGVFHDSSNFNATIYISLIMFPAGIIMRYIMECPCFYNGEYNKNLLRSKACCGSLETISCACVAFALIIVGSNMGTINYRVFFYSCFTSAFGTEVVVIALFTILYFSTAKNDFEMTHAAQFPEGQLPISMSDVGKRAMENFLFNPAVYGKCDANTAKSKGDYGGWEKVKPGDEVVAQVHKRYPHFMEYFLLGPNITINASKPPGVVDEIHHSDDVYRVREHLGHSGKFAGITTNPMLQEGEERVHHHHHHHHHRHKNTLETTNEETDDNPL
jgi:hypothetical protein